MRKKKEYIYYHDHTIIINNIKYGKIWKLDERIGYASNDNNQTTKDIEEEEKKHYHDHYCYPHQQKLN